MNVRTHLFIFLGFCYKQTSIARFHAIQSDEASIRANRLNMFACVCTLYSWYLMRQRPASAGESGSIRPLGREAATNFSNAGTTLFDHETRAYSIQTCSPVSPISTELRAGPCLMAAPLRISHSFGNTSRDTGTGHRLHSLWVMKQVHCLSPTPYLEVTGRWQERRNYTWRDPC